MARFTNVVLAVAGLLGCQVATVNADSNIVGRDHTNSFCMAGGLGSFGPALANAGVHIDGAVEHCKGDDKLHCAVNVLSVVESVAWVAAYITAVAGACTNYADRHCADGITGLVSSIVSASQASTGVAFQCPKHNEDAGSPGIGYGGCVVDTWEASWALARAGILINAAIIDCEGGASNMCTLDSLGVVSSIVAASHFVLGAVDQCQVTRSSEIGCAKFVTKLVGSLVDISAAAIIVDEACAPGPTSTRRLSNATKGPDFHQPLNDRERTHLAKFNMTEDELASDPLRIIRMMKAMHDNGKAVVPKNSSVDAVIV